MYRFEISHPLTLKKLPIVQHVSSRYCSMRRDSQVGRLFIRESRVLSLIKRQPNEVIKFIFYLYVPNSRGSNLNKVPLGHINKELYNGLFDIRTMSRSVNCTFSRADPNHSPHTKAQSTYMVLFWMITKRDVIVSAKNGARTRSKWFALPKKANYLFVFTIVSCGWSTRESQQWRDRELERKVLMVKDMNLACPSI